MAINVVSRWEISQDDAQRINRDSASVIKNHGAESVRLGRITTGEHAGQITTVVTYANWEAFGKGMNALHNDQRYQTLRQEAQKVGRLQTRNIVVSEEL